MSDLSAETYEITVDGKRYDFVQRVEGARKLRDVLRTSNQNVDIRVLRLVGNEPRFAVQPTDWPTSAIRVIDRLTGDPVCSGHMPIVWDKGDYGMAERCCNQLNILDWPRE